MQYSNKTYPLSHLADKVNGKVIGDHSLKISGLCSLETPVDHHITFIRGASPTLVNRELSKLSPLMAAVVSAESAPSLPPESGAAVIVVKESYASFLDLIPLFYEEARPPLGIHPTAVIDSTATIAEGASIGAHCVIGPRTSIGKNALLHPHVTIYEDVSIGASVTLHSGVSIRNEVRIGDRVTIHNNTVIGADGFGYTPDPTQGLRKVPQLGAVSIGNDVEIGASSCIDRGAFGPTTIGRGTKIDNLCQIGHNVTMGSYCIICAHAAIGGSTRIGDRVIIGGRVGIADHLEIVSGVRMGGGGGIITPLLEPGDYMGFPAIKAQEWRRMQVHLRKMVRSKN